MGGGDGSPISKNMNIVNKLDMEIDLWFDEFNQ